MTSAQLPNSESQIVAERDGAQAALQVAVGEIKRIEADRDDWRRLCLAQVDGIEITGKMVDVLVTASGWSVDKPQLMAEARNHWRKALERALSTQQESRRCACEDEGLRCSCGLCQEGCVCANGVEATCPALSREQKR